MRLLTAVSGVQVPQQAPINIWHLLVNRCFYYISPPLRCPPWTLFLRNAITAQAPTGVASPVASANKHMAPVNKQVFLLYFPATALSAKLDFWLIRSADASFPKSRLFGSERKIKFCETLLRLGRLRGLQVLWQAPIIYGTC